jgi:hypothetical protein
MKFALLHFCRFADETVITVLEIGAAFPLQICFGYWIEECVI